MVTSASRAFDAKGTAEAGFRSFAVSFDSPDSTAYAVNRAASHRTELDLRDPAGMAQLERMDAIWRQLSATRRREWLARREIVLPPRAIGETEVALLPGGAVTLRGPDAILLCDPLESAIFTHAEVKLLRRALRKMGDVTTLVHTRDGVLLRRRVPKSLPPQTVTIVPNPARLPVRIAFNGPVLIQWGHRGAIARPLVPAPTLLALAASLAASPLIAQGPALLQGGPVFALETWQATDAADRCRLIAVALMEHISDLVADGIGDDLRHALMEACVEGHDSLAHRIGEALAVVPPCFVADPASMLGAPPPAWRNAIAWIHGIEHPRALLGLDNLVDPLAATRALRGTFDRAEVMAFGDNDALPGEPVSLHCDAALFLARMASSGGRLGIAVPTPASPIEIYTLAQDVALMTGGRVTAVAPCWGFCHRVGPDGEEAGNAGWFGMGAGLDEAEFVLDDIEFGA